MFSRIESIERLADEGGHDARSTFLRVATEQFITHFHRPTSLESERFGKLCMALIDQVDSSTRLFLATRLSPYLHTPPTLLERLLLDNNPAVSDEVIRLSCHFTHDELQKLCLEGKVRHACAVAQRTDLDLALTRILAKHPSEKVVTHLLNNRQAPFDAESIRIITRRILQGELQADSLLARDDLPALWLAGLYPLATLEQRQHLRIAIGNEAGPPELPIPQEVYPHLFTALLRQDVLALRHSLARMLRLAPESTGIITDDVSGELLILAMLAAACDESQALSALSFTHPHLKKQDKMTAEKIHILYAETSRRSARRIISALTEEASLPFFQPHMVSSAQAAKNSARSEQAAANGLKSLLRQASV